MRRVLETALVFLVPIILLHTLVSCTKTANASIPVQYEYGGENPNYQHGTHCTDGRVF